MQKTILRRMAPLVAGIILAAQTIAANATFPYIASITRASGTVTVGVATGGGIPPGHTGPRTPASNNYYWWENQGQTQSGVTSISTTANNVCVYVYPDDSSGDYSYAIHDEDTGAYIWNRP